MRGNDISVKASGEAAAVDQATVGHRSESKAMEWSSTVERKVQDICVETGRRPQGWMGEQEDRPVSVGHINSGDQRWEFSACLSLTLSGQMTGQWGVSLS